MQLNAWFVAFEHDNDHETQYLSRQKSAFMMSRNSCCDTGREVSGWDVNNHMMSCAHHVHTNFHHRCPCRTRQSWPAARRLSCPPQDPYKHVGLNNKHISLSHVPCNFAQVAERDLALLVLVKQREGLEHLLYGVALQYALSGCRGDRVVVNSHL